MTVRSRLLFLVVGLAGAVVVGLWLRRALKVYREEMGELTMPVRPEALPTGAEAPTGIRDVRWTIEGGVSDGAGAVRATRAEQHAWYVPPTNGALIVYLHGSPGSRSSLLAEARALATSGYGALLLDLPGYGASAGERKWDATYAASVRAALDFAASQSEVDPARLGVFGFSMGTCTAAQAAARDPRVRALVLRGTFTRFAEQLRVQFRTRTPFAEEMALFAAERAGIRVQSMDTEAAVRALGPRPIFLISGADDFAVPPAHSRRLAAIAEDAELWVVPGVGHIGFAEELGSAYFDRIRAFFDRTLGSSSGG